MKDWQLVKGYNTQVIKRINQIARKIYWLLFLPGAILTIVLSLLFIPLAIIDFIFLIAMRWVWAVFGKGKDQYIHTPGSVIIMVLLFLFLGGVSLIIKNILNLGYIDWKINLAVTTFFWLFLSAATIQIIVSRSSQRRKIKMLIYTCDRFSIRVSKIDYQLKKIHEITGYTPDFLTVVNENEGELSSERNELKKEIESIENAIMDINRSKIRLL
jgi:hypothetical protein